MNTDLTTPPTVDQATADALTQILYEPDDFGSVHAPWRDLVARPEFAYRIGLSEAERIELSYQRLKMINEVLAHPLVLATDPIRLAAAQEWITPVDGTAGTLMSIHHNLYLGSLVEADPHPDRPVSTDHTGVFLTTELACGNDAARLRTRATWDAGSGCFILHTPDAGAQKMMPNSGPFGGSKAGVVAARLIAGGVDHGPMLFHLPLTDTDGWPLPGIHVSQMPERTGAPVDHCLTSFDHVPLPAHALLTGDHGHFDTKLSIFTSNLNSTRGQLLAAIRRVTPGKLAMSAAGLGIARTALTIAVRYSHHRYISGRPLPVPIAAHRTHSAPLLAHLANTYAANFLHRRTVHAWATAEGDREAIERDIALTKAWVTWSARDTAITCRERCGAQGMFWHNGLAGLASTVDGAITAEGDNLPILVKAASETLFRLQVTGATEPVATLDSPHASLPHLRHLLAVAEGITARRARERFRADAKPRPLGLDRWNRASLSAVESALLRAAGKAADAFLDAVEACRDRHARHLLTELARLFLLQEIQPHAAPLQAHGHLTAQAVVTLPDVIEDTLAALTPHMLTLVEAFDLDQALASVPIAHATYQQAYDPPDAPWHNRTPQPGAEPPDQGTAQATSTGSAPSAVPDPGVRPKGSAAA